MRKRILWLTSALVATVLLGAEGMGQPPGKKKGPPAGPGKQKGPPGPLGKRESPGVSLERVVGDLDLSPKARETARSAVQAYQADVRRLTELAGASLLLAMKEVLSPEEFRSLRAAAERPLSVPAGRGGRGVAADGVIERILSFDTNKDGKLTRDELPERMHDLIDRGDTNKDGALDREEVRKLSAELPRDSSFRGAGARGGFGPGSRGPGGRGGRGAAVAGPPPGGLERAVAGLPLSGKKKETASAAVQAHRDNVRKLTEVARAGLLLKLNDVLSEGDLKKVQAALDRPPGAGGREQGPPAFRPGRR